MKSLSLAVVTSFLAAAPPAPAAGTVKYSTQFDLAEAKLSEKGVWQHKGEDWTFVETSAGHAYGTQTGTGAYNDSYAYLSGFPADHAATGVISRLANMQGNCTREVEILLRWSDEAHKAKGYECNIAYDGSYAEIVRWNGKLGDFTYLAKSNVPGGVKDGDTVMASVVGNRITVWVNGKQIATATDSTYTTGNPGIGFWRGGTCGTKGDYGFTSFSATSDVAALPKPVPASSGWLWGGAAALLLGIGGVVLGLARRHSPSETAPQ